ncbi:MAG: insulinase family protein [Magnetococcus sp. DMHC-6]
MGFIFAMRVLLFIFFSYCGTALAAPGTAPQHFLTPEGMTVILLESHANPMVEVRLTLLGGSAQDPIGKEGLAALTAWMFNEGGGELDTVAFREKLDFYGISLSSEANRETQEVHMTTLTTYLDKAWSLMADALLRPRFDATDFARAQADTLATLLKNKERPDVQANQAMMATIYGSHPYGRPEEGTPESVKNVRLEDLKWFHNQAFRSSNMVLAVAGDIHMERLKGLVRGFLSGLPKDPGYFTWPASAKVGGQGAQNYVRMDIPQTDLRLGLVGIDRQDPDYYAAIVLNHILGGADFGSRLTEEIREKRGLTYSVYSYFSPLSARGPFIIGLKTKTESARLALDLVLSEVDKMARDGVTEKELQDAKQYLTGSFPLRLDGLGKLADNWATIGFYHRGWDYLARWPERILAVTQEDLRRIATKLLDIKRLHIVAVGRENPFLADNP